MESILKTKEYSHLKWGLFYPAYLLGFVILENLNDITRSNIIHVYLDDVIPFNEYFFFFYMLWHVLIVGISIYFALYKPESFKKFMKFMSIAAAIVFIVYLIYPTQQDLRPAVMPRDNIFTKGLELFYSLDTPTNTCPSMHVIGAAGLLFALSEEKDSRVWTAFWFVISVLISVSTLFVKQHSIVDVIAAIPVGITAWIFSYSDISIDKKKEGSLKDGLKHMFGKNALTIPNAMSLFRLILIPVAIHYLNAGKVYMAAGALILSGITDVCDGFIARKFNMVSDLGKILDPIADKLTQLIVVLALAKQYPLLNYLIVIFIVKEYLQALYGVLVFLSASKVYSSQWFGKLSTGTIYVVMAILILFKDLPLGLVNGLITLAIMMLLIALFLYSDFHFLLFFGEKYAKNRNCVNILMIIVLAITALFVIDKIFIV